MAARCTNTRLPLCFRYACPGHVALSCSLQCGIKVKDDSTGKERGTPVVQEVRKKWTGCDSKNKPTPCIKCGNWGHFAF